MTRQRKRERRSCRHRRQRKDTHSECSVVIASETGNDTGALKETSETKLTEEAAAVSKHNARDNALRQGHDVRRNRSRRRQANGSMTKMCWREKVDRRGTVSSMADNDTLVFDQIPHEPSSSSTVTSGDEQRDTVTSSSEASTYFEGNESPTNKHHFISNVRNNEHDDDGEPCLCPLEVNPNDTIDSKDGSAVEMAIENGDIDALLWHLRQGTTISNALGQRALQLACRCGSTESVQLLFEQGLSFDATDRALCLEIAVDLNDPDLILQLNEDGMCVDVETTGGNSVIHLAVQYNHHEAARALLQCGADPNKLDRDRYTPLHYAVWFADIAMTLLLLENGALACGTSDRVPKPLDCVAYAALDRVTEVDVRHAELLLSYGASFEHKSKSELIRLSAKAICENSDDLLRLLLENGCRSSDRIEDMQGLSLLELAAQTGNVEIGEVILRHEVDTELFYAALIQAVEHQCCLFAERLLQTGKGACVGPFVGYRCLEIATGTDSNTEEPSTEMLHILHQNGISVTLQDNEGMTVLHWAAWLGIAESVDALLDLGADVEARADKGITPLHCACMMGNGIIAQKLVEMGGCNPNRWMDNGYSPLHIAVLKKQEELVKYLLETGVYIDIPTDDGWTPIMSAVAAEDTAFVKLLLDAGAEVVNVNRNGESSLWIALSLWNVDILSLLLNAGAYVDETDEYGRTPLLFACQNNQKPVINLLLEHDAYVGGDADENETPLTTAIRLGDKELVDLLLSHCVEVNYTVFVDEARSSPLHLAASLDLHDIAKSLIDVGANVNMFVDGCSPLILAASLGHVYIVHLLIQHGADLEASPTTLDPAIVHAAANKHFVVVRALAEAGADVNVPLSPGTTMLHVACLEADIATVRTLLRCGADPFAENADSLTALDLASFMCHEEIAGLISQRVQELSVEEKAPVEASSSRLPSENLFTKVLSDMESLCTCPITLEIMEDPVVAPDGRSYERTAISQWLELYKRSPLTRERMSPSSLIPNWALKQQIELFHELRTIDLSEHRS